MTKQMTIESTDTDLSLAADTFLDAHNGVKKAKKILDNAHGKLLSAMNNSKLYSLKHSGYVLEIKQGSTPKEKIQVL